MTGSTERSRPAYAARARLPDFFIVGHPKCGTTALYEMLRGHPQIHLPVKEPWFFVAERAQAAAPTAGRSLEQYLGLFSEAGPRQRVGEATPSYLRSRTAAGRIAELQPDARIIAILREPASFLRSFHLQSVQAHIEVETEFEKALALEQRRRRGESMPAGVSRPEDLFYSDHVRYVEQLRRYHAVFPAEQVLVLIYEDFRADNEATVRRVLRFLDIEDGLPVEIVQANPSSRVRSRKAEDLVDSLTHGRGATARAVKATVKTLIPAGVRRRALRTIQSRAVYGHPLPADEALMLALRRRFKGEVVALSEYLERDLVTLWGYDDIP
jgi:hypothetical protein